MPPEEHPEQGRGQLPRRPLWARVLVLVVLTTAALGFLAVIVQILALLTAAP